MLDPHRPQEHPRGGIDLVPAHLRPILAALFSGATDVAASHRLNVSPRTFSRRVAELLEYFEVQTRFQAGVEVASRGWRAKYHHNGLTTMDRWPVVKTFRPEVIVRR